MTTLRCLVIDDEPLAIDVVVSYLKQLGVGHIATSASGIEAFQLLQQQSFDLLFLDIQMPQLTGFELLKSLPQRPLVVITTAYRDYAVEGFEWAVLDYLVKPFSFPRFLQTMEKATRALQQPGSPVAPEAQTIPLAGPIPADDNNFLFLRVDHQWVRIDLDTLLYIESLRDYVRVVTQTKTYIVHSALADLTARLPQERFIRVHRSYTLALDRVDRVSQHCAHVGNKHIPISRAHRQEVYRRLGQ
ncbi:MAG TPA: LytTR family DNA-binding domain-containing protein [Puia sp.]|nr:LytTR family DNA-binding domain-containing protein [Puia sp.]